MRFKHYTDFNRARRAHNPEDTRCKRPERLVTIAQSSNYPQRNVSLLEFISKTFLFCFLSVLAVAVLLVLDRGFENDQSYTGQSRTFR